MSATLIVPVVLIVELAGAVVQVVLAVLVVAVFGGEKEEREMHNGSI